ncbi:hypothetical protein GCM10010349_32990 [Streptomyces flavofungini]|nr:hypothetical protein GCM10010349_32990 [Streptomyces flavofungini]
MLIRRVGEAGRRPFGDGGRGREGAGVTEGAHGAGAGWPEAGGGVGPVAGGAARARRWGR